MPLDEDDEHARYDPDQVAPYFAAATQAALVLAEFRAPYRGRSTPVNAWWGSFDLAVSLFSGRAGRPPVRRLHHAQLDGLAGGRRRLVAGRHHVTAKRPSMPTRTRRRTASRTRSSRPPATRWDAELGLYILDWADVVASPDPHAAALEFAHSAFRYSCEVCGWDPALPASAEGIPPPVH